MPILQTVATFDCNILIDKVSRLLIFHLSELILSRHDFIIYTPRFLFLLLLRFLFFIFGTNLVLKVHVPFKKLATRDDKIRVSHCVQGRQVLKLSLFRAFLPERLRTLSNWWIPINRQSAEIIRRQIDFDFLFVLSKQILVHDTVTLQIVGKCILDHRLQICLDNLSINRTDWSVKVLGFLYNW